VDGVHRLLFLNGVQQLYKPALIPPPATIAFSQLRLVLVDTIEYFRTKDHRLVTLYQFSAIPMWVKFAVGGQVRMDFRDMRYKTLIDSRNTWLHIVVVILLTSRYVVSSLKSNKS
jgi:hypothetical protein